MKIDERIYVDGDRIVHRRTFANDPHIEAAKRLRELHGGVQGENRLAGVIPMHVLAGWVKEAGLTFEDGEAVRDLVRQKLLSGEFDRLRVWDGSF
jgi:hypothetical protein